MEGSGIALPAVIQKNLSTFTWVFSGQSASSRQSGMSWSSATGSITMPERICAPTSEPFSTTTMLRSALSCFSLIAAERPEGPAPTITTSNSMDSRGGNSSLLMIFLGPVQNGSNLPVVSDFCGEDNHRNAFHRGAMRRKLPAMSQPAPEPAPNVTQLLAFYLEAGVDCALGVEPVDRLAEPEPARAPAQREAPPTPAAKPMLAAPMLSGLAEPPPAPDAAIASARELARTAPTLEVLRDL